MNNIFLINEYQLLAERTMNKLLSREETTNHALFEMCSELGEIHSAHQKKYQGHKIDEAHQREEVGDLLWGIAEYCTSNGWKMSEILGENIEKLKKRYPDGFSEYRSVHRDELE